MIIGIPDGRGSAIDYSFNAAGSLRSVEDVDLPVTVGFLVLISLRRVLGL